MLLLKIIIAAVVVITLAEIAERANAKTAAIVAGLPIGSALVLYFYAIEFGVEYSAQVSSYNILGLSASLSFVIGYYLGSKIEKYSLIFALLSGLIMYTFVAFVLSLLYVSSALIPVAILLGSIIVAQRIVQNIAVSEIDEKKKLTIIEIGVRTFIAVFTVVVVSSAPYFFDKELSGVLSSFPSAILPLFIILHVKYSKEVVYGIIKHLPYTYIGIMLYSLIIGDLYILFGENVGTIIGLSISIGYLLVIKELSSIKSKKRKMLY